MSRSTKDGSVNRVSKSLFFVLLLAGAAPLAVRADEPEHEAAEAGHGEHGHHGPFTLHDVLYTTDKDGNEKANLEFWGSVVNFALLVYLIRRGASAPLAKFLGGRREGIERGILEAADVKKAAEEAFNTYTERMKSLDGELAKLRKDVAEASERERARIVAEANDTVARLKTETETLIQRQGEQLESQIRREVVTAAAEAAEKAVRELTTPDDQKRLADAFMRELSKIADKSEEKRA
jgi:F-type H+-transporting ATPase subunit b